MASNFIVGLDVGTAAIKVAVAERQKDGRPLLRAIFKQPSLGLRKGAVVDLAEASQAIARAISEVKKLARHAAGNIYIAVGTPQIKTQSSRGITAVSRADTEIYQDDIDRVIRASQAVNLGPNRMIIHSVNREFVVDGVGDISDPLGMSGNRLEVSNLIIDVFAPHVKSLMRAVELSGGQVGGLVLGPLVAGRSALSKNQRDLGVILIDIGFGTTGMSVYEENKLLGVSVFPVGAGNITNDLAVGLRMPVAAAENLKLGYGYALAKEMNQKEMIELKKFAPDAKGAVSRRFMAEIIESRLAEIFEFVNNELRLLGKSNQLAGGVVLVGGGAKLPGLSELVKQELKLAGQIGLPVGSEWSAESSGFTEFFEDPEYVNVLGLVLWGVDQEKWIRDPFPAPFKFKNIFRYFIP